MPGRLWRIALVASTVLKGIFDYAGTYLVNHAGFGMITDLRNDLYNSVLRRSAAFFQKHTTGTLISTIINDIERVQFAMSSVLAEFLQQFFTFLFTAVLVVVLGRQLAWVLLLFVPFIIFSAVRIGRRVRTTTRSGQDKLADIQNILHETITGNRIVKAFSMESWEIARFRKAAQRLVPRQPALGGGGGDQFSADGYFRRDRDRPASVAGPRAASSHNEFTLGTFVAFITAVFSLYNPVRKFALFNNNFQQALGASSEISSSWIRRTTSRESRAPSRCRPFRGAFASRMCASPTRRTATSRAKFCATSIWKCSRGEVVAVVGSSGAGKSTLVHLIPRFFDVTAGRMLIDGRDVRDATLASLRSQDRRRHAGDGAVQRHRAQQHCLRTAACSAEAGGGRGPRRSGARLHYGIAGRLRHRDRRARRAALRRRAPAHCHRARAAEECADPDSGRGHVRAGQRVGSAGADPRCRI